MSRRDFTERDIHMALDGELPERSAPTTRRGWMPIPK